MIRLPGLAGIALMTVAGCSSRGAAPENLTRPDPL